MRRAFWAEWFLLSSSEAAVSVFVWHLWCSLALLWPLQEVHRLRLASVPGLWSWVVLAVKWTVQTWVAWSLHRQAASTYPIAWWVTWLHIHSVVCGVCICILTAILLCLVPLHDHWCAASVNLLVPCITFSSYISPSLCPEVVFTYFRSTCTTWMVYFDQKFFF